MATAIEKEIELDYTANSITVTRNGYPMVKFDDVSIFNEHENLYVVGDIRGKSNASRWYTNAVMLAFINTDAYQAQELPSFAQNSGNKYASTIMDADGNPTFGVYAIPCAKALDEYNSLKAENTKFKRIVYRMGTTNVGDVQWGRVFTEMPTYDKLITMDWS